MRYILVLGIVVTERDPWGGVIDIDRPAESEDEQALFDAIDRAINDPEKRLVGMAEAGMEATWVDFEKMPFTGTIEEEVIIFICRNS